MTFKTSLDNLAKGITAGTTVLFAVIIGAQFLAFKNVGVMVPAFTTMALLLIYFTTFGFRPVNYQITGEAIVIHRPFADVSIKFDQVVNVRLLEKDQTSWSVRTFGVGGLFGYYGKFANTKLGSMTWYATRKDRMVLVQTMENKKIILTPDDPAGFVADFNLKKNIPG